MELTIVQGAFFPVPPVAGGAVEKIWYELGLEFARRGVTVRHVSRRWPGLADAEVVGGVEHVRISSAGNPKSDVLAKLRDLVYSFRSLRHVRPHGLIVTNTFFLPVLLSLTTRGRRTYVSINRFPKRQMFLYRRVARLQCASSTVADAVRSQTPAVSHLVNVIPNYVNGHVSDVEAASLASSRTRTILFVGRIHPEKGIQLLLSAFSRCPPEVRAGWTLRIVGPHAIAAGGGGDSFLESLKTFAKEHSVDAQWTGPIYGAGALTTEYRRAGLFVYPSTAALGEALPVAPLEAMSQACPIVVSSLDCFSDYVTNGVDGAQFSLDVADLAQSLSEAMQKLMLSEELRWSIGMKGLETARKFTLALIADQFLEDFKTLTHGR